jgi:maltose-binding protein MalE
MLDQDRQAALATTTGMLPVRASVGPALSGYSAQHPQWAEFWKLAQTGEPVPIQPGWTVAAPILQDAFSQLFSGATTREQLPDILIQLDQTIQELLNRTP